MNSSRSPGARTGGTWRIALAAALALSFQGCVNADLEFHTIGGADAATDGGSSGGDTGGGSGGGTETPPPPPSLSLSVPLTTMLPGDAMVVSGAGGTPPYSYAVLSGLGSMSGDVFTAGAAGLVVLRVTDSVGQTADSTSIVVNNNPIAVGDTITILQNAAATNFTLTSNDLDPDGHTLSIELVSGAANGTVTVFSPSQVTLTPNPGFTGRDSFTYQVRDSLGWVSNTTTVTVKVMTPYTWTGAAGSTNWSMSANWHGGAVPTGTQTALFDNTCDSNCSPMISTGTIGPMRLAATYSGVVSVAAATNLTVNGTAGITIQGGTFVMGSGNLTVSGTFLQTGGLFDGGASGSATHSFNNSFQLQGGTFAATPGTTRFYTTTGAANYLMFRAVGGTFVHNSGRVLFEAAAGSCADQTLNVEVQSNLNFFNLEFFSAGNVCGSDTFLLSGAGQIFVGGNFTDALGSFKYLEGGQILVNGDVAKQDPDGFPGGGGSATLVLVGSGSQAITAVPSTLLPRIRVDKPSGTVSVSSAQAAFEGLDLERGTFIAPTGVLTVARATTDLDVDLFRVSGVANFNHNGGSVTLRTEGGNCSLQVFRLEAGSPVVFHHLTVDGDPAASCGQDEIVLNPGGTIRVNGDFVMTSGSLSGGSLEIYGPSYVVDAMAVGGMMDVSFGGTTNYYNLGGMNFEGTHTVFGGATLILNNPLSIVGISQDMLVFGSVLTSGNYLDVGDMLTISLGGSLDCAGGSYSSGTLSNSGTINSCI